MSSFILALSAEESHCKPMSVGGLDFRKFYDINDKALVAKLRW